jgi:hypothetical protein
MRTFQSNKTFGLSQLLLWPGRPRAGLVKEQRNLGLKGCTELRKKGF